MSEIILYPKKGSLGMPVVADPAHYKEGRDYNQPLSQTLQFIRAGDSPENAALAAMSRAGLLPKTEILVFTISAA
ncbi:hypothetical protein FVR03_01105 [Pontibacter qinzhouensis]|uniref:Uncharacterized protein n=1 Tax=Pontibacter qinzhouensis TaxID=2603253 RepID=A0A5C8KDQ3_9BACT|nr:hypothetical protein [Pontibacter qinzhouensis]TXK52341.1 hypothetical protein FVR03_01105 [Pontibacter qinzhouensis]